MTKRVIILASAADKAARGVSERLSDPDVRVLTPADLSQPGWCYQPGTPQSQLVAGGEALGSEQIAAVVTRLPWVSELELAHIAAGDRAYVAAEMGALLLAWLSELDCPVANRPGPTCLCGPFWRHEHWIAEAAGAGLAVEPARRVVATTGLHPPPAPVSDHGVSITVVGVRWFGDADESLHDGALRLARTTGVETLTARFSDRTPGARLLGANPWPLLEDDASARALLDHLLEAATPAGMRS